MGDDLDLLVKFCHYIDIGNEVLPTLVIDTHREDTLVFFDLDLSTL